MSPLESAVESALANRPPSAAVIESLWSTMPETRRWMREIERHIEARGGDRFDDRPVVLAWLRDSARAAFPPDHAAVMACEVLCIQYSPDEDGGFAEARALHARVPNPKTAALAMNGAFVNRDYAAAEQYARLAGDRRGLAGALLHLHRWNEAFAVIDDVLREPGPLFGGGGITVLPHIDDARESAISESVTIARWASARTPEWVRALGGMWEAFMGDPAAAELERRYIAGLHALGSLDDFEVVIRQARERKMLRAARLAARVGCERFDDDSWIHSVHGNLAREMGDAKDALKSYRRSAELLEADESPETAAAWMNVADSAAAIGDDTTARQALERAEALAGREEVAQLEFYRVRLLRRSDPTAALERVLALVESLSADPHALAESNVGFAVTDLAIEWLLAVNDRRATDVQNKLVDAKVQLWGECPAVWLERHNLGTVHARLGDKDRARQLITAARERLVAQFGAYHEHVKMCDRSLATLAGERAD